MLCFYLVDSFEKRGTAVENLIKGIVLNFMLL